MTINSDEPDLAARVKSLELKKLELETSLRSLEKMRLCDEVNMYDGRLDAHFSHILNSYVVNGIKVPSFFNSLENEDKKDPAFVAKHITEIEDELGWIPIDSPLEYYKASYRLWRKNETDS